MFQVIFCSAMQAFMYATKKNLRACPWYGSQHLKNFQLLSELSRLCSHSIRLLLRRHENQTVSEIGSHIKTVRFRRDFCNRAKLHCTALHCTYLKIESHIGRVFTLHRIAFRVGAKSYSIQCEHSPRYYDKGGGRGPFTIHLPKMIVFHRFHCSSQQISKFLAYLLLR